MVVTPAYQFPDGVQAGLLLVYQLAFIVAVVCVLYAAVERPFLLLKRGPSSRDRSVLSSTTVPWQRCLLVSLSVVLAFELLYWRAV